jgi:hypothetical protein
MNRLEEMRLERCELISAVENHRWIEKSADSASQRSADRTILIGVVLSVLHSELEEFNQKIQDLHSKIESKAYEEKNLR